MLFKKSDATQHTNSNSCIVKEYVPSDKDISFATATINGRYPEVKRVINETSEEIYFVISGTGTIHSEKGDYEINEGDFYHFDKGERYWVEGFKLSLALINIPKWYPEQHKTVD